MRIVAFVGSPVEDNEKDVCLFVVAFYCSRMTNAFHLSLLDKCDILSLYNFFSPNPFQLVKLAKRLKKEKVNVDVINFGEEVTGMKPFF